MQTAFEFLPSLPARPKRAERLFFALFPDKETSIRVSQFGERFVRQHRLRGTLLKPPRLHISLWHIDDFVSVRAMRPHAYAAEVAAASIQMAPFDLELMRIRSFETPRRSANGSPRHPLVLLGRGDGLFELHRRLAMAMGEPDPGPDRFRPHMTLHYGPAMVPREFIEPIRFTIRELALVHSEVRLSRYNILHRRALEAPPN